MKTKFIHHIYAVLLPISLILQSCNTKNTDVAELTKFDRDAAIVEIINETLPILLPDSIAQPIGNPKLENATAAITKMEDEADEAMKNHIAKHGVTVFLDSNFLSIDSFVLPEGISKQTRQLIARLKSTEHAPNHFSFSKIRNYGNVHLISSRLRVSPSPNNHFGAIHFSHILFHADNKKAILVFGKHRFPSCFAMPYEFIHVEKKQGKWVITGRA